MIKKYRKIDKFLDVQKLIDIFYEFEIYIIVVIKLYFQEVYGLVFDM